MSDIALTYNIILGITVLIIGILIYGIRNILKKLEAYEDMVEEAQYLFEQASSEIKTARKFLDDLDEKGTFKSDDEVGNYFEYLQQAQDQLDSLFNIQDAKKKS